MNHSPHTFHIPVMGTGFTIDTPLKVARFGISSVISLVDDTLIEQMREYHAKHSGLAYQKIDVNEPDARARRITAYLNLMNDLLRAQVRRLQAGDFAPGTEITRYFEMLPDGPLKEEYRLALAEPHPDRRRALENALRPKAVPGSIDVNIMTKLDRPRFKDGVALPPEFSDAMAALRGYANSSVRSCIVFSAGMNQRLYSYAAQFPGFLPDSSGAFAKEIILKVSDFRSAEIQGKMLAKRGLWVSEYRIESGLNCGGHAFATDGLLMGPILQEFRDRRKELGAKLAEIYRKALAEKECPHAAPQELKVRVTAQGGIGTAGEDRFLRQRYSVDSTGWGTPFLLVPEATNVDDAHLRKLAEAGEDDVYLSDSSPLGIPFWSLRRSESEEARRRRIEVDQPGSVCPKGFLAFNTEFTHLPLCTASRAYQKLKLNEIAQSQPESAASDPNRDQDRDRVTIKACICHDLGGSATVKYGIEPEATTAVCCGPNIVNFSRPATLEEMVGHIYGRLNLMSNPNRPHMFIAELKLYVEHLRKEWTAGRSDKPGMAESFVKNLRAGIDYYSGLAGELAEGERDRFIEGLIRLNGELLALANRGQALPA